MRQNDDTLQMPSSLVMGSLVTENMYDTRLNSWKLINQFDWIKFFTLTKIPIMQGKPPADAVAHFIIDRSS